MSFISDHRRAEQNAKYMAIAERQNNDRRQEFERTKARSLDEMKAKLEPKVWKELREAGVEKKFF